MKYEMENPVRKAQDKIYHELQGFAIGYIKKDNAGMIVCISDGGLTLDRDAYRVRYTATSIPLGHDEIDDPEIVAYGTRFLHEQIKGTILSTTLYDFRRTPYVKLDPLEGEGVEE